MGGIAGRAGWDEHHCHVAHAIATCNGKYLFEASVWIDSRDFAVVKIAGRPAKFPSFWIKQVGWTRHYKKLGEFWLPIQNDTLTVIRIFGNKGLRIVYQDYVVNQSKTSAHDSNLNPPKTDGQAPE